MLLRYGLYEEAVSINFDKFYIWYDPLKYHDSKHLCLYLLNIQCGCGGLCFGHTLQEVFLDIILRWESDIFLLEILLGLQKAWALH